MHFLGVAGMPRRIPGEQPVLTHKGNNCSKDLVKTDNLNLKLALFNFTNFLKLDKFESIKGKPFG